MIPLEYYVFKADPFKIPSNKTGLIKIPIRGGLVSYKNTEPDLRMPSRPDEPTCIKLDEIVVVLKYHDQD